MARSRAFNLTAEINLRGPANIGNVVSNIRRQLTGITVDITPRIDARAMRNVTTLNTNLQTLNRTFQQTQRSVTGATTAIRNFGQAINGIANASRTITQTAAATQNLTQRTTNAARSIGNATTQMAEFGKQSAIAVRRFAAFSLVTNVIYSFTGAVTSGIKAFIDFDKEFVRLQQVTGQSAAGLKDLSKQISFLSTSLGVSSSELTTVAVTLAQAGLSAKDTEKALKALALSSLAPSFDDMNQTVEGSIALMRQFGIGAGDLEKALGSINAVAAQFAVEASDLIIAIQRTGGVFATASKGVSEGKDALNEFLAVFTSIRATTRESAETIATGLRTIFTRIQRESTVDALKKLGIELRDVEGKFVGPYEAIKRLSEGLSKIDPRSAEFAQISEELGGFRQIGKVIPLIQQFAVAQNALNVAQKGSGSLAENAGTAQLALANQIAKVREEFLTLIRSIGESESFRSMISIALQFASALIKIADAIKIVLPALTAMAAFKGLQALTQFSVGFAGAFSASGGARGAGARLGGGSRFASGGLVPGSGDSDTVSAMLTPGEFVIRKKAVQAIGVGNLHAVNGYAGGGFVNNNKYAYGDKPKPLGRSALARALGILPDSPEYKLLGQRTQEGMNFRVQKTLELEQQKKQKTIEASKKFGLVGLFSGNNMSGESGVVFKKGIDKNKTPLTIFYGSLNKKFADQYEKIMKNGINKTVSTVGGSMARRIGGNPITDQNSINKILKKAGIETAIGTLTEASIGIAGAPFNNDIGKQNDSIDFPNGLGSVGSLFGVPINIPSDATRDVKGKGISRFLKQVSRYLDKKNPTSIEQTIAGNVKAGKTVSAKRMSSGGSAQDTVPALLTPGEFVIKKQAASRLGSATLNKLNNADKISGFNSGGSVGIIQRFAGGGDAAQKLGLDAKDAARVKAAMRGNAEVFENLKQNIKGWPTAQVGNALKVLTRSLEKGDDAIVALNKAKSGIFGSSNNQRGIGKISGAGGVSETRASAQDVSKTAVAMRSERAAVLKRDISERLASNRSGGQVQLSTAGNEFARSLHRVQSPLEKLFPTFTKLVGSLNSVNTSAQSASRGLQQTATTSRSQKILGKVGSIGSSLFSGQMIQDPNGPAGQMIKKGLFRRPDSTGMGGMALTMVGGAAIEGAASLAGGETTATGRAIANVGGDMANYAAMGAMLGSMIPGVGTALGGLAGAAVGAVTGLMKLEKANREAAENAQRDTTETSREQAGKNIQEYSTIAGQAGATEYQRNLARSNAVMGLKYARVDEQALEDIISKNAAAENAPGFFGSKGFAELDAAEQKTVKEISEARTGTAQQAQQILATDMMRSSKSFKELESSMNKTSEGQEEFKTLTEDIASADRDYVAYKRSQNKQIAALRSEGRDEEANVLQGYLNEELDRMRLRIAERALSEDNARIAAEKFAKEQEKLNRAINRATVSLLKSFSAIDQSFNRTAMIIGQLGNKRSEIVSGKKSLTSNQFAERAEVFKNPLAYSREERQGAINQTKGMFGPIGDVIDNAINAVEDARNKAINAGENLSPAERASASGVSIGRDQAKKSLLDSIKQSGGAFGSLAPALEANIEDAFKNAKPEDTLDDIIEKALGPAGEIGQKAMSLFAKANEEAAKALGELAQTSQAYADITTKNIARTASLFEMQAGSRLQEKEALGINVTPQEKLNARLVGMSKRLFGEDTGTKLGTGGVNTSNILRTRASLVNQQKQLEQQKADMEQKALAGGPQEQKELIDFQNRLASVNNRLETMDTELQNLPQVLEQSIGDLIGEMQKRVGMLQARKEAGAGFAEKLVTSTPQELIDLNNTYALLNNTLQGNITTINDSRVAQEAYFKALREGKNPQEAMNDAQAAFANENKKALSMFNELAQVSGLQGPEMDKMRADLIQNLAASTGQNNNPLIQNILAQLRQSPEQRAQNDPVLIALKGQAEALRQAQVEAVNAANEIDRNKQAELLTQVSQKILEAFTNVANMIQSALQAVAQATGTTVLGSQQAGATTTPQTNTNKPPTPSQQTPNAPTVPVHPQTGRPLTPVEQVRVELGLPLPPVPGAAPGAGGGAAPAAAAGGGAINLAPVDVNARPDDAATGLLPSSTVGVARPGTIGGISLTEKARRDRQAKRKSQFEEAFRQWGNSYGRILNFENDIPIAEIPYDLRDEKTRDSVLSTLTPEKQKEYDTLRKKEKRLRIRQRLAYRNQDKDEREPITIESAREQFQQAQMGTGSIGDAVRNMRVAQREEARLARGANFSRQQEEKRKQFDYQRKFGPAIRAGLMPRNYKDWEHQQQANAGPAGPMGGVGGVPAAPVAAGGAAPAAGGVPAAPVAAVGAAPVAAGGAAPAAAAGGVGGPAAPPAAGGQNLPDMQRFVNQLAASINNFGGYVDKLTNIKPIQVEGNFKHEGRVEVVVTGAAALDMFSSTIQEKMDKAISDAISTLKLDTNGQIISNVGKPKTTETNPFEEN